MKIRTLFLCCTAAMMTVSVAATGVIVSGAWRSYDEALRADSLALTTKTLLQLTERVTLSRGLQNGLLLAEQPASAEELAKVANARRGIADALRATHGALEATAYPAHTEALASLDRIERQLMALWGRVDTAVALAKGARDGAEVKAFSPAMIGLNTALGDVANGVERASAQTHSALLQFTGIARLSWDMRDAGGRRTNILTTAIGSGRPLTAPEIEAVAGLTGEIRHAWARLQATAAQISDAPRLQEALGQTASRFFGEADPLIENLVARGRAGGDYGIAYAEAWSRLVKAQQAALLVRDAAMDEATEDLTEIRRRALVELGLAVAGLLAALTVGIGSILIFVRRVLAPLMRMTGTVTALAAGDIAVAVEGQTRRDEIGAMATAVGVFKNNLIHTRGLEEETALARASSEAQRRRTMQEMADGFEQAVGGIVGLVAAAATELEATARSMTHTATRTTAQSSTVSAAAGEAASNVGMVAAAAEELGSSVQEIGRQVHSSTDLARTAVAEAGQSAALVQELTTSASRIGEVVGMISTIAAQTNLLALNATIEAARAGTAGKGFAVVAAEVKALADQTARAIGEIAGQVERIQGATGHAVAAIEGIGGRIREISSMATMIATSVEEQGAATQEIARNVAQAAAGTGAVTATITDVAEAAQETGAAANQVLAAASELSRHSEQLSGEVGRFLATVRAA